MEEQEWKELQAKKDDILTQNKARVTQLCQNQIKLSIQYKNKEIDRQTFQFQMLQIRNEIGIINKRNFDLVQEWVAVDIAYRAEHPDQFNAQTLDELDSKLKAKNIEVEKWRLNTQ